MSLNEFKAFIEASASNFVSYYQEMHKINSASWPTEFGGIDDWWQQFCVYVEDAKYYEKNKS
jgi:hypothetical protein